MPARFLGVCALLSAVLVSPWEGACASAWQAVPHPSAGERKVEIDRDRILRLDEDRVAAWTRLTLDMDMTDSESGKRYDAVQALNHYDCAARRFTTVKRIYMRGGRAVHFESIVFKREIDVGLGSLDDRLMAEACKIRMAVAMHADMRSKEETRKPEILAVAETASRPPERLTTPARRLIQLPKIDKSQLEEQAKAAEAKPAADAKAEAKQPPEPKPVPGKAEAKSAPESKPAPKAPVKAEEKSSERPALSRQAIERMYATSGPRRAPAPKKKAEEKPEPPPDYSKVHWGYEGLGAPENWGKLRREYRTCETGRRQSPIDIRGGIKVDLEPMRFDYKISKFRVTDNGHTLQVDVSPGNTLNVMGRRFELLQLHFHRTSEERINGRYFDMSVHLVHQDDEGRLGVVAVLLERGPEHPLVQTVWNHMPLEKGQEMQPSIPINLNQLLPDPESRAYYTYMGSLTTPPCTEDVLWMVLKQPLTVSPEQIAIFSRLYRHNARPIQPSNGRLIKESR